MLKKKKENNIECKQTHIENYNRQTPMNKLTRKQEWWWWWHKIACLCLISLIIDL